MKKRKQMVALFVAASICVGIVSSSAAQAAPKIKLSTKSMTLKVGQTRKLLVKKSKKAAKWSVVSGKKVIQLKNKKKNSVKIVGVKKGTAKVQAKIGKTKYFCKVTVKETKNKQPQKTPAPVVTNQPVVNNPSIIATSNPNSSTPAPDSIVNKLPENINEEDLQGAKEWGDNFRLRDNTEFGVSHWEQSDSNEIEIELEDGMQSLKEAVPDPAACIHEVLLCGTEIYEVLIRDVSSSVESTSDGTDGVYYTFKLYFYKDGVWYCENMVMRATLHTEEVQGTIFNRGEKLSQTEFSYLVFARKDGLGRLNYCKQYDGETFVIKLPAQTYDVFVQMAGVEDYNYIPIGTVTVEKGVVNKPSLKMNIISISGKITQNGNKLEEKCRVWVTNEKDDRGYSYQTDADGNYKAMLPEGDYKVEVRVGMGDAYCGELQVSGTESEINKDFDVEVKSLMLDQQQNFTMTKDGKSTLFKFTPTETAVYEWNMLGNGKDGKYDWCIRYEISDVSTSMGSWRYLYAEDKDKWSQITDEVLLEGVTYWMSIEGKELTSDMSVALKLTKSDKSEIINLDQTKTWTQTGSASIYYYAFTAPEDGTYRFSGTASQKETLEDWNSVRCQLYGIDVKESDIYNFDAETKKGTLQKDVELKKGNVVIAEVYVNAYTMSGDFTITKVQ